MPWQSLIRSLDDKPRVLAGPMLRQVTPTSVTVWFVLRTSALITLIVRAPDGPILTGERHTYQIGKNLHIVAVTANKVPPTRPLQTTLVEDVIYLYDAIFDFLGEKPPIQGMPLAVATKNAMLAYPPHPLPSFCLPPSDINKLRLMHGSCRHPNGEGKDSLALLDEQLREAAEVPSERPHQLLLTGDQIYADDVAASLLILLSDASDVLLGWKEILPLSAADGPPRPGSQVAPYLRSMVARHVGLTSDAADNHLLSLGEYLCMYLFVWSGVLWDVTTLPTSADVVAAVQKGDPDNADAWKRILTRHTPNLNSDIANVISFRSSLRDVRCALANIPTYMILDDHDVTDDFNMTRDISVGLYGNEMGKRIAQNALVAYSLCQHWGNAPEQFEAQNASLPGTALLRLLDNGDEHTYEQKSPELQRLVGVHSDKLILSPPGSTVPAVFHDDNTLTYNYSITAPGHQIIVTDTRTWRSFPNGGDEAPVLLPKSQLQRQIVDVTPPTDTRALIVVLSTNAPPGPIIRFATAHPNLTTVKEYFAGDPHPDLYDSWELPSDPFDRLFKAISDRLPLVPAQPPPSVVRKRHGCAIILSGDVHSGFASRLLFTGSTRFEDPIDKPQPVSAVFAQLVASSLRNQTGRTIDQHRGGYDYPKWIVGKHHPEGYAGWNLPTGASQIVGQRVWWVNGARSNLTLDRPSTVPTVPDEVSVLRYSVAPHYGYRLDYLAANSEHDLPFPGLEQLPLIPAGATAADRKKALEAFLRLTGNYRTYNTSNKSARDIVGVANLGEVTFDWSAGDDRRVNHTLRWTDPKARTAMFTTYAVSLNPNDARYKYDDVAAPRVTP